MTAAPSRIAWVMGFALLAWAIVEVAGLLVRHTTGAELYGLLIAAMAVIAASLALFAMRSATRRTWLVVGAAGLWLLVALGGIAGVVAHIVGPVAGEGPIDLRPRPVLAPLAFTAMGVVGEIALWVSRRLPAGSAGSSRTGAFR